MSITGYLPLLSVNIAQDPAAETEDSEGSGMSVCEAVCLPSSECLSDCRLYEQTRSRPQWPPFVPWVFRSAKNTSEPQGEQDGADGLTPEEMECLNAGMTPGECFNVDSGTRGSNVATIENTYTPDAPVGRSNRNTGESTIRDERFAEVPVPFSETLEASAMEFFSWLLDLVSPDTAEADSD